MARLTPEGMAAVISNPVTGEYIIRIDSDDLNEFGIPLSHEEIKLSQWPFLDRPQRFITKEAARRIRAV